MSALIESRFLEGPNLYFPRPAVKLTLELTSLMTLPVPEAKEFARQLGMSTSRPGVPDSAFRQRFAARVVTRLVRRLAAAAGLTRLAVRTRAGTEVNQLIVAVPFRDTGRVDALGRAMATVLDSIGEPAEAVARAIEVAGADIAAAPKGRAPRMLRPRVPVVAITGTNGKTTTSRMLGHIAATAGMSVGWSSTEGVYVNGEQVASGDYSGPGGARKVLETRGLQLAVTETARGGILRRGVGVAHNNVSVVTNVTADHLGLDGIDTLDQLAEVKSVVPWITKPDGWCVLNADDPRTFAMRLISKATPWVFSRDPESPNGRTVVDAGGRFTTVLDGWICVLRAGADPQAIVKLTDVPMTLSGLSRVNVENSLAVVSAALALGFSADQIVAGLTSFLPGENNPGRMNIWTIDGVTVIFDMAHNEASLEALLEVVQGLAAPEAKVLMSIALAGDRTDEVFTKIGEMTAMVAHVIEVSGKPHYLRGRDQESMNALLAEGASHAGVEVSAYPASEHESLESLLSQANPGDVVAIMTHEEREQMLTWMREHGGGPDSPETIKEKVERASGESGPA